jgi:hypothetical protein
MKKMKRIGVNSIIIKSKNRFETIVWEKYLKKTYKLG